jgi:transposase
MPKYLYAQNVTEEELTELQKFKKQGANEFVRGRIIELSSGEEHPKDISNSVGLSVGRVREWIRRFNKERIPGLVAKKSPGRPRKFSEGVRYQVRAIISDSPSDYGIPKSRWTLSDMCRIAVQLGIVESISKEQIRRLFVEIGWTYTRAKKWQRSPDPQYRRRRNRQRRLEKWASEDDTIALLYWDQFWRNLLHLPMAGSYSPKKDFQRIPPNERLSLSVYLALDMKTRETYHLYMPYCCSECTIASLKEWIREYADHRALVILWDKASWHTAGMVRDFVRRWNRYAKCHGKVRVIIHTFPTKAPWLNPMEAVIGMIIRYGLKNKSHKNQEDVCSSIDGYIFWRNSQKKSKVA